MLFLAIKPATMKWSFAQKIVVFAVAVLLSCSSIKNTGVNVPSSVPSLKKSEPITTSFDDAAKEQVLPDDFGNNMKPLPLVKQPRGAAGGYLLSPGLYESTVKSYCLHAGSGRPSKGDGYLYAPLKGEQKEIFETILNNAGTTTANQPETQALLWAVLARTKPDLMSPSLKETMAGYLSEEQIGQLRKGSAEVMSKEMMAKLSAKMPPAAKKAMETQNKMREMFASGQAKYEELEKVAVPVSNEANDRPEYKSGRWSQHEDGYYMRFYPEGYQQVRVQIYIPDPAKPIKKGGSQKSFNSLVHPMFGWTCTETKMGSSVAQPANSAKQRLAMSNQPADGGSSPASPPTGKSSKGNKKQLFTAADMDKLNKLKPYAAAMPNPAEKYHVVDAAMINAPGNAFIIKKGKDAEIDNALKKIAAETDNNQKGAWGEVIAMRVAKEFESFTYFYEPKLPGNQGFDVLALMGTVEEPCLFRIVEAKPVSPDGLIRLPETETKNVQMGNTWVTKTIQQMKTANNPESGILGDALNKNKGKIEKFLVAYDSKNNQVLVMKLADFDN